GGRRRGRGAGRARRGGGGPGAAPAGGPPLREEVLVFRRPSRFSYTVLSGAPVRDHVGTVELTPNGGGTKVVYAVRMMPTVPVAGGAGVLVTKQAIQRLLQGVTAQSARLAAAADG